MNRPELKFGECLMCGKPTTPFRINKLNKYCYRHRGTGAKNPLGTKRTNTHGYVKVLTVDGWKLEHVVVMEAHLDRSLLPGENVHHLNGVRTDNSLDNLELWSVSQPAGQRVEDRLRFYQEFLEQYGYKVTPPCQ